ncbi:hypothetical protein EJ06DRAFT_384183 [Trichodelitschia bisporula]|uniref:BHLH domain-containing protein n=1 Tax=Trichodelitschia bisporula TaxID=703511 RepID=A0A6G1HZL1_9PEZI|nr:hypothetical protein EJ06DRAFT_384183 [Trichodelitschia bisporula]
MTGSPATFIKEEPEEFSFNRNGGYGMSHQFGGDFSNGNGDMSAVNPSDLTMSGGIIGNQFNSHINNFGMPNAGIADDELLDLINEPSHPNNPQYPDYGFDNGHARQNGQYFPEGTHGGAMSIGYPTNGSNIPGHSSTPDGAPITSPFTNDFSYPQYRTFTQGQGFSQTLPTAMPMHNGSYDVRMRKMHGIERHASDSRSPMTPKTQGLAGLHISESGSVPANMLNMSQQLHHAAKAQQWSGTPGSGGSFLDSPLPSPHAGQFHPQISEIITGKHASLPAKVENNSHSASLPTAFQSQEAKKKRRRESHNAVERRRRDNINERIHDLSRLVPGHRLEDEKVRKHITNNGPMSPTIAANGLSPPHPATSLLAGGNGRRAAGNITQGLPIEEKDKGPNKGDILNGAVSWTRDLMWMVHNQMAHEEQLRQYIESLGGTWPFEETENEKRMKTEILAAVDKNGVANFHYTRGPGSGLRVPNHTNYAGEPISPQNSASPSNQMHQQGYWLHRSDSSGRGSFSLKEEDEYGMDMG